MPTLPNLRKTFQRAITAALMTSPALAACGNEPGIEGDPDFVPVTCAQGVPRWLTDLDPEPAVDFLELVSSGTTREASGEACKTASDLTTCQAALQALRQLESSPPPSFRIFSGVDHSEEALLRVTRGDEVFAVDSLAMLRAFLAPVDSPQKAMLLTQASSYNVACKDGGARPTDNGFEVQAFRGVGCGGLERSLVSVDREGNVALLQRTRVKDPQRNCVVGRRPAGLHAKVRPRCTRAGDYLARASSLEAASVEAFRRLSVELKAHGAPRSLIAAARRAARDEVRHAKVTAKLARRLGGHAQAPKIDPMPVRGLEAIALENAVEGCVRETFGALEGRFQALRAADPGVRHAYQRIAEDELRHAALSWRVARWLEPRLDKDAQRRVRAAKTLAIADLRAELGEESSAEIRRLCGVPSAREARTLFASLSSSLA